MRTSIGQRRRPRRSAGGSLRPPPGDAQAEPRRRGGIEVRGGRDLGRTVKLGFPFPGEASVLGEEAVEAIQLADRAAATALPAGVRIAARAETQGSGPSDR
jgi:hypothetical protein